MSEDLLIAVLDNPDVLKILLGSLSGVECLRGPYLACIRFQSHLTKDYVWEQHVNQEYPEFIGDNYPQMSFFERYRRAYMRAHVRNLKWSRPKRTEDDPCARQGSDGTALHIGGPSFLLFGGWSVQGMAKDVHILHAVEAATETAATTFKWTALSGQSRLVDPTGKSAEFHNGLHRGTYGHTVTAVPLDPPLADAVLIIGGVTQGGYRYLIV
jgi:hypothetical protein